MIWDTENQYFGKKQWWKDATFYQVYPASFKDSNGDGLGDIQGIISKIGYLHSIGVDVLWLSPIFESPQADMGYDVSDYQKVYAPYGTVKDIDDLILACHKYNIKLILDLVVNHTSIKHEWFEESRSSTTNPKRDWYIWRPPRSSASGERLPPTNWRSYFAGSTWTFDEKTQEYYLHLYAPEQPDLNWDNPSCRQAIYENAMKFWLDRGIDGFRIDTVNKYSKNPTFPDAPITDPNCYIQPAPEMWCNGPKIHQYLREMQDNVLKPYNAISVGELSFTPEPNQVFPYVSASRHELNMAHEFSMIRLGNGDGFGGKYHYKPFALSTLKRTVEKWQSWIDGTDAWTTIFNENHDNGRAVSRFGRDSPALWSASAKMLALWQITLSGTIFLYQGQEIGMKNMPASWDISEYKDIESQNYYKEAVGSKDTQRIEKVMEGLHLMARDHARLPFQWDSTPNAGFCTASKPWMRVHDEFPDINVAKQEADPNSILTFYKMALKIRKQYRDLFIHGTFDLIDPENETVFAYLKTSQTSIGKGSNVRRKALILLNFSDHEQPCSNIIDHLDSKESDVHLLLETEKHIRNDHFPNLRPYEGRVYVNFDTTKSKI